MQPPKKLHPGIIALIVIVLIGIAATAIIVINSKQETTPDAVTTSTTAQQTADTDASTDTVAASSYKDGTYTATGTYSSPGGQESIDLTVTLASGVITSTSLVEKATDGEAKEYQDNFAAGYKELVVGKSIDRVSLSRVAGSSLTSNGFNDALDQIKTDAES